MIPTYAYARYSSDNQRDESIESQLTYIRNFAEQNDYEILDVYADHAVSGTSTQGRRQFQKMLKDIHKGRKVQAVLVWDLTRYARNTEDAIRVENQLLRQGVEIIAVAQPMRTKKKDGKIDTSALVYRRMMHVMSEATSFQTSEQTAAHMYSQSLRPNADGYHPHLSGAAPYGYRLSERKHYKDHRYLQIDETEAPVVRQVWQWVDDGKGYREIASLLNEMGYRTRRGAPFSHTSIHDFLTKPAYAGIYVYGKYRYNSLTTRMREKNPDAVVVYGGVPAIISMQLYERVVSKLNRRKKGARIRPLQTYILGGLVFCGECGDAMSGDSVSKERQSSYRCYSKACKYGRWRKSKPALEHLIVDVMMDSCFRGISAGEIAACIRNWEATEGRDLTAKIQKLAEQKQAIERRISGFFDLMFDTDLKEMAKKKLLEAQIELRDTETSLRAMEEAAAMSDVDSDIEHVQSIMGLGFQAYEEWDERRLQTMAHIFISQIILEKNGRTTIIWQDGSKSVLSPPKPDGDGTSRRKRLTGVLSGEGRDCQI